MLDVIHADFQLGDSRLDADQRADDPTQPIGSYEDGSQDGCSAANQGDDRFDGHD